MLKYSFKLVCQEALYTVTIQSVVKLTQQEQLFNHNENLLAKLQFPTKKSTPRCGSYSLPIQVLKRLLQWADCQPKRSKRTTGTSGIGSMFAQPGFVNHKSQMKTGQRRKLHTVTLLAGQSIQFLLMPRYALLWHNHQHLLAHVKQETASSQISNTWPLCAALCTCQD